MSDKRRGLGRGLGALIPEAPTQPVGTPRPSDVFFPGDDADARDTSGFTGNHAASAADRGADHPRPSEPDRAGGDLEPVPGATFAELPVAAIRPNPRQPRTVFDEDELAELVHSIATVGVLQPIVVRRLSAQDAATAGVDFELIMGERRLRASRAAERDTVPAIIRDTGDDALLRDALLENLHRAQLNPLEEAAAYGQLLDDFACTHDELARRIGRSRPQISNTMRLLRLPALVQRRVAAGVLSAGHARALLGLDDPAGMERLAQRIVAEGLSVRSTEEIVAMGGDQQAPTRRTANRAPTDPAIEQLASSLSDRLDTRVKVTVGKRRGRLTVEFADRDDLDRIIDQLGLHRA